MNKEVIWVPNDLLYKYIREGWTQTLDIKDDPENNRILHSMERVDDN